MRLAGLLTPAPATRLLPTLPRLRSPTLPAGPRWNGQPPIGVLPTIRVGCFPDTDFRRSRLGFATLDF